MLLVTGRSLPVQVIPVSAGEHHVTVDKSIGDYWSDNTPEMRKTIRICTFQMHYIGQGWVTLTSYTLHDAKAVEFMYDGVFNMNVPIVMTLHVSSKRQLIGRRLTSAGANPLLVLSPGILRCDKRISKKAV